MFVGTLCTWFVPETKGKTLEQIWAERDGPETDGASSDSSGPQPKVSKIDSAMITSSMV
jgi:hypothetical protein